MKILSKPKGNAEEYGRWSVNPYLGCSHQCSYCYLKTGPGSKRLGVNVPTLKKHIINEKHAYHVAMAEIIENREQIIKDGGLFMTFTSDPCIEETQDLMFRIARESIHHRVPVTFLTKAAGFFCPTLEACNKKYNSFPDDTERFKYYHHVHGFMVYLSNNTLPPNALKAYVAFGWTLTGHDEMEPHAPSNADRIETMKEMSDYGMKVWTSIEPVIDFPSSFDMIKKALDAGCTHFKIGLMTRNTKVCRRKYDHAECLAFIQDVMNVTRGRATVYWKQSFRDFIGGTPKHRLFTDEELHRILDEYPNAVGKDWSMFQAADNT